jgi:uncharacterized protein DUF4114
MSWRMHVLAGVCLVGLAGLAAPAAAAVAVTFGASWDATELQQIVDTRYGAGNINVHTDYIGAHAGDLDPWFWADSHFSTYLVREIAGNADRNTVGWYLDGAASSPSPPPVILNDGIHDGIVFDGPATAGDASIFSFPLAHTKFGFYLNPNGSGSVENAPEPERFFTNRFYNDIGPNGSGALHTPTNGDVQALIFDVSRYAGPNTWLVAFEDLDSGSNLGPPGSGTDNDYNDIVFEVTAFGATPVIPMTFGGLKSKYLH